MIDFYLDRDSGLSPYMQLVCQVREALRLGFLRKGDQLPTVRELSIRLAINQNTVLKAYRELDYDGHGLIGSQRGVGTFVLVTLTDASLAAHEPLRQDLTRWLTEARSAGMDIESIQALFSTTLRVASHHDHAASTPTAS